MDKAREIFKKVWISYFEHSNETDEQLEIILEDHDYIFEAMDKYAQQMSRKRTFEFLRRFSGINPDEPVVNEAYDEYFNKEDK